MRTTEQIVTTQDGETGTALAAGSVQTWAGVIHVWASPAGVRRVAIPAWGGHPLGIELAAAPVLEPEGEEAATAHLRHALRELALYFAGELRDFTVPLDPDGTPFLHTAWAEVARVPYGETRSYGEVAATMGIPFASRAVGRANATNPLAPIVPCHRVVGSDGHLTGYGPGLPLKQRLLVMEGALPDGADAYDAWVARLTQRSPHQRVYLATRALGTYCVPGCTRSRRYSGLPGRVFFAADEARAAGYEPCARCRPTSELAETH